jgi:pimeloyl-ACP methyl ester carboxylesterase
VERRLARLGDRHGQVALTGHSRGGHYVRALGHRRPELVSHAISIGAGLRQMLAVSYPTRAAAGRARSPLCLTEGLRLQLWPRLHSRRSAYSRLPDEHLFEGRRVMRYAEGVE